MAEEVLNLKESPKDYTVKKNIIFFGEDERVSLDDMKRVFTLEAIATLIKNNYVQRDNTGIKRTKG
jgi:hypothetical protein